MIADPRPPIESPLCRACGALLPRRALVTRRLVTAPCRADAPVRAPATRPARHLPLIPISQPTRQAENSLAAFFLKKKKHQLYTLSSATCDAP
ncbi:hypothetical protein, partial [Burkholderia mallei]|uniref:hypothetical protein n=1 Tax=Burkholderia mallei TaxID=13373 RepID=UPI001C7D94C1